MQTPIRWPAEAIWQTVEPLLPGCSVEIAPTLDSTNTELMRRARQGQQYPTLLVAEQQTAGRGRLGRPWSSAPAHSGALPALTFSLGLPLAPRDWSGLSLAVGCCVAEQLQASLPLPGSGQPGLMLKWPNDLWLNDGRKLGGILLETASSASRHHGAHSGSAASPDSRYLVIGIGINILPLAAAQFSVPPAYLQELAPDWTAASALERIARPLVQTVQHFAECGFAPWQARFAARDVLDGRGVTLSDGRQGLACGVAADGALLVRMEHGLEHISSAEVSVRPVA